MSDAGAFAPADRIVIPVEGSDREYIAQQWAVELAAALGLPVRAIHVSNGERAAPSDVFTFVQQIAAKHSVELTTKTLHGTDVVREIVEELGTRDVCVIGTRKLSHHYHVGSVAGDLIEKAPCPVQVVRLE